MNKLSEIKIRIYAVEIMSHVKKSMTYKELSNELKMSAPVISRYIKGHVLPSLDRAQKIIEWFEVSYFRKMLQDEIQVKDNGVIDVSFLTYDTVLQRVIAKQALNYFRNVEVTKVLTVETNGIPIALQIGNEFIVDVIIARKERQIGFEKYIEATYTLTPPTIKSLYIPKNALKKSDKVLVVDDLIRTGNTIKALVSLVNKSGATVSGIFTVIDVNQAMERLKKELNINVPMYSIVSK